jgi:hypothetical protein
VLLISSKDRIDIERLSTHEMILFRKYRNNILILIFYVDACDEKYIQCLITAGNLMLHRHAKKNDDH